MHYQAYMRSRGVKQQYRRLLKLKNTPRGFTIPFFDADGQTMFNQTRYTPPITIDGKEVKATFPPNTEIDFCHLPLTKGRKWRDVYANPKINITITESVPKGAAVAQFGYAVLTTGSVYGHRSKKTRTGLVRGFDTIPWAGRRVRLLFDNDSHDNTDVQDALFDLGAELTKRGALVEVVLMPAPEWDEAERKRVKLGIDDFVAQNGADAKAAIRALAKVPLDDPLLSTWGKYKAPPRPNAVDSLTFAPFPIETLTVEPPPRQYVVEYLIGAFQLAYFVAAGGMGKGFIVLDLAVHIAVGTPWMGHPVQRGRVVLLCLEDSREEIARRLYFITQHYAKVHDIKGRALAALHATVTDNVRCESLEGLPQPLHLIAERDRELVRTPELALLAEKLKLLGPNLIIPDPLNQLHALSENDNTVGAFMTGALGYLRSEVKAAILVPAHVSKEGDNRSRSKINGGDEFSTESANIMRGAGSFATGARSVFVGVVFDPRAAAKRYEVHPSEAWERFGRIMHVKCNYGPKADDIYIMRRDSGIWVQHDTLEVPLRTGDGDESAWVERLNAWLLKEKRTSFSAREVAQNDTVRASIFGNLIGKSAAQKFLNAGLNSGAVRPLTEDEYAQIPAIQRRGGGERFCMEKKVSN